MLFRVNHSTFTRILCLFLVLHLLNLSIDPKDPENEFFSEDLTYNDIESFTELVAEVFLNKPNAFKEHDEQDTSGGNHHVVYKFYFSKLQFAEDTSLQIVTTAAFEHINTEMIQSPSINISLPPPKV